MADFKQLKNANLFWYAQEDSSSHELFAAADTPIAGTRDQFDLSRKRSGRLMERAIRTHASELQQSHQDAIAHIAWGASKLDNEPISGMEDITGIKFLNDNLAKLDQLLVKTAELSQRTDYNACRRSPQPRPAPRQKKAKKRDALAEIEQIYSGHIDRRLDAQVSDWAEIRKYVASETVAFAEKLRRNGIGPKEVLPPKAGSSRFYLLEDLPSRFVHSSSLQAFRPIKKSDSPQNASPGLHTPPNHQARDLSNTRDVVVKATKPLIPTTSLMEGSVHHQIGEGRSSARKKHPKAAKGPAPVADPKHPKTPKTQAPTPVLIQEPLAVPIQIATSTETPETAAPAPAAPPTVATAVPNFPGFSSSSMQFKRSPYITDMGAITIRKMGSKGVQVVCEAKTGPICLGKPSQYDDANFDNDPEIRIGKKDGVRIYRRREKGCRLLDIGPVEKIEPLIRRYFLDSAHGQTRNADLL